VASAGPGSFTGIRVGIATALGLKDALDVELSSFSVLEAMASDSDLTGVVAIPMGRGAACAQRFANGTSTGEPFNIAIADIFLERSAGILLVHSGLAQLAHEDDQVSVFGDDLATALVRMSIKKPLSIARPIFLNHSA
jgi:tRNA threonylcarbamoyladenosine biosynthesis protein TsaB